MKVNVFECFDRGALIDNQVLNCDGIKIKVSVLVVRDKSVKSLKLGDVWPLLRD